MRSVFSRVFSAIGELRSLEHEMAKTPFGSREYAAIAARYERLNKLIAAEDGYNAEVKIRTVLGGMGFRKDARSGHQHHVGGEKTADSNCAACFWNNPKFCFWTSRQTTSTFPPCSGWKNTCRITGARCSPCRMTGIFSTRRSKRSSSWKTTA